MHRPLLVLMWCVAICGGGLALLSLAFFVDLFIEEIQDTRRGR